MRKKQQLDRLGPLGQLACSHMRTGVVTYGDIDLATYSKSNPTVKGKWAEEEMTKDGRRVKKVPVLNDYESSRVRNRRANKSESNPSAKMNSSSAFLGPAALVHRVVARNDAEVEVRDTRQGIGHNAKLAQ